MMSYGLTNVIVRRMARSLTVGVVIVALAVTGTPRPAQAAPTDAELLGTFLGAAATLFILGSVLDSKSKPKARPTPPAVPEAKLVPRHDRPHDRLHDRPRAKAVPAPIPSKCLRRVKGADTRYAVAMRCLNRVGYRSARRLPQACRLNVRSGDRVIEGYSLRCLRRQGYKTTHAH